MTEPSPAQMEAPASLAESRTEKKLISVVATFTWVTGSLFLSAGHLNWTRGWISIALFVVGTSAVAPIVRYYDAPLLKARAKWRRKDTKPFDKIFLTLYLPLVSVQPLIGGLDAGRYHWTSMPPGLLYVGVLLFTLSLALITWVMVVNPFAESTVRIQTDRGHTVVMTGPYCFVRHPMYVGIILLFVSNALIWGSVLALSLAVLLAILLVWRTSREDRTLRQELAGYGQYAARTRYRLLPGVW